MKTEFLENYLGIIDTYCECVNYDEETNTETPADNCYGCWEDKLEGALECVNEWVERTGDIEAISIEGVNMSWLRRTGYKIERNSDSKKFPRQILDALMIDGDFTIWLELEGKHLTARRASHDEPMGANFTISPVKICQGYSECLETEGLKELEGVNFCAWCLDIEQANR